jgi:hypothetical protein
MILKRMKILIMTTIHLSTTIRKILKNIIQYSLLWNKNMPFFVFTVNYLFYTASLAIFITQRANAKVVASNNIIIDKVVPYNTCV